MTTFQKILVDFDWRDSDDKWREQLRRAGRKEGDEAERAAFLSPGFLPVNADAIDGKSINRFMGEVPAELAAQATERAESHRHPFTAALLLDFAATDKPKSKDNRVATLTAANRYIDAVEHFSAAALDHVIAISDAIARAVDLLGIYSDDASRLAAAVQGLVPRFLGTGKEELIGDLAMTLSRRLRKAPGNLPAVYSAFQLAVEKIKDARARARCACDLEQLARLAGELPSQKMWCAEVVGNASLERVGQVAALISANDLIIALQLASDAGHPLKARLLAALQKLGNPLESSGMDIPFRLFKCDAKQIDSSVEALRALPDLRHRLAGCAYIQLMPTAGERSSIARILHPGKLASLVNFVVLGDHGPTGEDPDSVTDYMALNALVMVRAQIIDEVLSRLDLTEFFPANETACLFAEAGLIKSGQEILLADAWRAWTRGEYRLALFALFPFIEQAFRNACGRGLGRSRTGGVVARVGDTIVTQVEEEFGEEVAAVFGHLLTKQGARRHGFAHGYQKDEPNLKALAAYCIHLLCFAFAHQVGVETLTFPN